MHCRFAAVKTYDEAQDTKFTPSSKYSNGMIPFNEVAAVAAHSSDQIDLDMDDDEDATRKGPPPNSTTAPTNQDEISLEDEEEVVTTTISSVPENLRAQLPAAFARPGLPTSRIQPGQPTPAAITNKTVRFLALDKCLPGRKFLQLLEIVPLSLSGNSAAAGLAGPRSKPKFEYDPEWLAITRVFNADLLLGNKFAVSPQDLGEAHYLPLIEKEENWVTENIVRKDKLGIPENFAITAPPFIEGTPEIVSEGPVEYNNPQMNQFCDLLGIENKFYATEEERQERMRNGPPALEERRDGGGRGGRGSGRGHGRGGHGRGRGNGRGRGRGRQW
jgi:lariat debranching enzyme